MTILREQLRPASYKGFPFLVNTETKNGGKKVVSHEYVNSNKRFTEELGQLPPRFTIEAILHGDNAIVDRIVFEDILDQPEVGELVHPVYGSIQVKSTTHSVSSSQTSIGEFRYSINFETSEDNVTSSPDITSSSQASSDAATARNTLDDTLESKYRPPTIPKTLSAVASKGDSIFDKVFTAVSSATNQIQSKVSDFTKIVTDARSKINTIVQQASTMKSSLKDMYAAALQIVETPADLFDSWKDLTDFGFLEDPLGIFSTGTSTTSDSSAVDTFHRKEEDADRTTLNEHTRLTSLVNLYESSAHKDYDTEDEINEVREFLNTTYNKQMELFTVDDSDNTLTDAQLAENPPLANDPDVRKDIQKLRTTVNKILDQKEQVVWRIETIEPKLSSVALTAYRFYGNIDNLDILKNLNPSINVSNSASDIQAVVR